MFPDLLGFISTHVQPKPSHGDPFQAKFCKISNSDLKRILDLVASFSQSFSPNRATATPFGPVSSKYSTLIFEYIPGNVKRKRDF